MLKDDLLTALDPVEFAKGFDIQPDPWQETVLRETDRNIILNCCRQSGKSTTSGLKGYHRGKYYPDSLVLLVSPSLRQSKELFLKVLETSRKDLNPPEKTENNKQSMSFSNGSRIVSLPATEGTVRGYSGPSLIIIDEAAQVEDELYYALRPMLAVSHGQIILLSTPKGKRGFFYRTWIEENDWLKIKITANDCSRITKKFLKSELQTLGELWYEQEYFNAFHDAENQVISTDLITAAMTNLEGFYSSGRVESSIPSFFGSANG